MNISDTVDVGPFELIGLTVPKTQNMTDSCQIFQESICGELQNTTVLSAFCSVTDAASSESNPFTFSHLTDAPVAMSTTEQTSSLPPAVVCAEVLCATGYSTERKPLLSITSRSRDISSNPPIFQPSHLRHPFVVPPANNSCFGHQYSASPGKHTTGISSFPSPFSAFTQLQPKNVKQLHANSRNTHTNLPLVPSRSRNSSASGGSSQCSPNAHSPVHYDMLSSSASSSLGTTTGITPCIVCGEIHDSSSPHRYRYSQPVDTDLCCCLCRQPLVEPLETKCGHTFCTPCLKSHLAVQALCPVDRQIINYLECQQASKIVQRLLDKLVVICPNSNSCGLLMHRAKLEEHLRECCPVTASSCENTQKRPTFGATTSGIQQSLWQFPFSPHFVAGPAPPSLLMASKLSPVNLSSIALLQANSSIPHIARIPMPSVSQLSSSTHQLPVNSVISTCSRTKAVFRMPLPNIDETYDSPVIPEGTPVSIVIRRPAQCSDLGFAFVGGADTPLPCILIQEIYLDGLVAVDGRLRPGDQILEVNGRSLIAASHNDTRQQLSARSPYVQLTVFRESLNWKNNQITSRLSHDEIFHVKLCKRRGRVLGIKLVGKRHLPGLYVLELVPGCEAEIDGRLRKDDQILEINGINLSDGSQEQAAHIINTSADFVDFKVRRRYRSDTPDILRTAGESNEQTDASIATHVVSHKVSGTPRLGRTRLCSSESARPRLQRTRSVQSDTERTLVSSFQTETSSLHASQTASSLLEGDVVATSTSPLLNEDDDQETDSGRSLQHFTHPFKDTGPIESKDRSSLCRERMICVEKSPEEPLGISVAGGRHSLRGDTPLYVTNISPECALGRQQLIKLGDILLEVNGVGLVGLTHDEAVNVLRGASRMHTQVQLRLIDAPETCDGMVENFIPSWKFWLQLPPICQLTRAIHLRRNDADHTHGSVPSGQEPLGFSILGGSDGETGENKGTTVSCPNGTNLFHNPIVIKSIVPGLLAHRDGRLKCGDLILAVNSVSMLNVSHNTAVQVFKKLRGDVILQIISWPGTIV